MKLQKWPFYEKDELDAVYKVLESGCVNYWTGKISKKFEKEFAEYIGCKYALALANGSLALSCAYLAIGIKKGDEIITTPRSFVATASSASLLGGKLVFADVDFNSGNITAESIKPLITKKTKAIVIVHFAGWPAEISKISSLAKKYNIPLIEDCSQAHGAEINIDGKYLSVGQFGDINTWSFCQDKIISTGGEGGMITTNNKEYYEKIWSFKDHGKSFTKLQKKNGSVEYRFVHDSLGSNFRITEMQSAIGRIQLKKLKSWRGIRTKNANIISEILKNNSLVRIPLPEEGLIHAWYKFNCFINMNNLKDDWDREKIIKSIRSKGIPAFQGSCSELYLEKCFSNKSDINYEVLPIARELGMTNLTFLLHPTIHENEMIFYAENIDKVLKQAIK
tara:strand:+ start:2651 stop:3829 length:1179 start_codon:yes stop_codon:yes gene_type:complete